MSAAEPQVAPSAQATEHLNVASVTEEQNFLFYLFLAN